MPNYSAEFDIQMGNTRGNLASCASKPKSLFTVPVLGGAMEKNKIGRLQQLQNGK